MLQDFLLVVNRPFPGSRSFGASFAELVINPDEVSKEQTEKNRPDYDPEKIIITRRIPVDDTVLHFPSVFFDAALSEVVCGQPSIRRFSAQHPPNDIDLLQNLYQRNNYR